VTHDITENDEDMQRLGDNGNDSAPPLCLIHYFAERTGHPPEHNPKPPDRSVGRVVERRGNLIILEFAPPPETARVQQDGGHIKGRRAWVYDALMFLLLLACLLGCLAAFRF